MENNRCDRCGADNLSISKYCSSCGYELPKVTSEQVVSDIPAKKAKRKYTKSQIVGIIVGTVVAAIVSVLVQQWLSPTIDKVMMKTASELNKTCPIMLDADTRLDNVLALPNKTFSYNYTLVNYEKEMVDTIALKNYLMPNIINNIKTNPEMKFVRDAGVIMKYYYKDKNGNYLLSIIATPEQYK